jgi:hypothetical protein
MTSSGIELATFRYASSTSLHTERHDVAQLVPLSPDRWCFGSQFKSLETTFSVAVGLRRELLSSGLRPWPGEMQLTSRGEHVASFRAEEYTERERERTQPPPATWSQHLNPKRRLIFNGLHDVISHMLRRHLAAIARVYIGRGPGLSERNIRSRNKSTTSKKASHVQVNRGGGAVEVLQR